MPKIRTDRLEQHEAAVWADLTRGLEQLLAERSYDEITIADIAAGAGMARNTLYNYARDKATLVAIAAERASEELLGSVRLRAAERGSAADRLRVVNVTILNWFASAEHRRLVLHALFGTSPSIVRQRGSAPLERIAPVVIGLVKEGIAEGRFRAMADVPLTVEFMAGVIHYAALRLLHDPDMVEPVIAEVNRFMLSALGDADG